METTTQNAVSVWNIDPSHSSLHFSVKHMIISQTKGAFGDYTLKVESKGADFTDAKIELEIDVNSINTNVTDRDNHLRSADFFDVATYPKIKFVSTSMKTINGEDFILKGNMTIKDVTKEMEFKVNFGGQVIDPWGNVRAGFTLEGAIDRFEYGLTWNALIESGGAMVGKSVKLAAEIEIVKPQ